MNKFRAQRSGSEFERRSSGVSALPARGVKPCGGTSDTKHASTRSSIKERKGNALASGADEGRDKLRKASGSCK